MKRPHHSAGRGFQGRKKARKHPEVDMMEVLAKKTHAQLKLLRKAVKKAKQFEIQKVVRRLKQAKDAGDDQDGIVKLESQLIAARAADLERLAKLAATSVGLGPEEDEETSENEQMEVVDRRILGNKCVVDQLDSMVKTIKALKQKAERQNRKLTSSASEKSEASEDELEAEDDEGEEDNDGEELSLASDEEEKETSEEESEKEPDDEALQALEKLMASRKKDDAGSSEEDESNDSEDDSGVIENLSELEEEGWSSGDLSISDDDEKESRQVKGPKKKAAAKPKKPKNRLGQRERRKLAEKMHGRNAVHLKKEAEGGVDDSNNKPRKRNEKAQEDEKLHPSWAARRQQKLSISAVAPAGKKIVFGDDGGAAMKIELNQKQPQDGRKKGDKKSKSDQKSVVPALHPSWELKKKQAEAQKHVQPQGKKITFDSDDE